jgi:hypothetical protein
VQGANRQAAQEALQGWPVFNPCTAMAMQALASQAAVSAEAAPCRASRYFRGC